MALALDAPGRGLAVLLPLGVAYTAYSEWRNVYVTASWAYDPLMPTLAGIGSAPLAAVARASAGGNLALRSIRRAR